MNLLSDPNCNLNKDRNGQKQSEICLLLLCDSFFVMEYQLRSHLPLVLFFPLLLQFIMLTYIFMLAWLGVTAFTSLPVYMYFNLWTICRNATIVDGANLCLDLRQYGMWMKSTKYKARFHEENFHISEMNCFSVSEIIVKQLFLSFYPLIKAVY